MNPAIQTFQDEFESFQTMPENPRASVFALISIIARTVAVRTGFPTPTA